MAEGIKNIQDPMICLLPTRLTSALKTESKGTKKKKKEEDISSKR